MQALRFEKTGSFDDLALQSIQKPSLAPGEALVRVKAAGINGVSYSIPISNDPTLTDIMRFRWVPPDASSSSPTQQRCWAYYLL